MSAIAGRPAATGRLVLAAAAAGSLAALLIAGDSGVKQIGVPLEVVRAAAALVALVAAAGYAPTRLLAPREMLVHFALLVGLVGIVVAGLALSLLGFLGIPLAVSLVLVLLAGLAAGLVVRVRSGPVRVPPEDRSAAGGRLLALVAPAYLALLIVAVLLVPVLRDDLASIPGTNPDAMLGAGTTELLREAGPRDVRPGLPVDRMPYVWNSKYPIYYTLAATAELAGVSALEMWATAAAVVAALTALGFFLLARYSLRAGPVGALLAMAFVGADRLIAHLALHPYLNQLWGTLTLGPMLVFGLRFVDAPNRRDGTLLALFLGVGLLAYPLMVLFPATALGVAWLLARRERRGLALLRPRLPLRRRAAWILAAIVALPAVLALLVGVAQKMISAGGLLAGNESLVAWRGDLRSFREIDWLFGLTGPVGAIGGVVVLALAVLGLRRAPRTVAVALAATVAVAVLAAAYFRARTFGEYFHFKVLAFLFPLLLVTAACRLAELGERAGSHRSHRLAATGIAAVLAAGMVAGLRGEVRDTNLQADRATLELGAAAERVLPRGASVRLDARGGRQLWAGYVLAEHPTTARAPILGTTYPHPPQGRKADFILAEARLRPTGPWPDAAGEPLYENDVFRLYRMRAGVPGPDVASQRYR